MSNLNGEPPTDDLCFGYAMCTMEHLVQWRTVLRDGIFEHELLRPVLHGALRHLIIQHYKGKETAAAALAVAEEHGSRTGRTSHPGTRFNPSFKPSGSG